MDTNDLKMLRMEAGLSKSEAARRISEVAGGRISPDRRYLINAERDGTKDLILLEGMAAVYNVPFERVRQANNLLLKPVSSDVHNLLQNA